MILKDMLNHLDSNLEFILYKGDRVGVFKITDRGINNYLEEEITVFEIEDNRLVICLNY